MDNTSSKDLKHVTCDSSVHRVAITYGNFSVLLNYLIIGHLHDDAI